MGILQSDGEEGKYVSSSSFDSSELIVRRFVDSEFPQGQIYTSCDFPALMMSEDPTPTLFSDQQKLQFRLVGKSFQPSIIDLSLLCFYTRGISAHSTTTSLIESEG
jgi:hypothetical protein